ncbi:unnamed protein product [Paramecium pentaurelia]|uniref:Sperm-tail PG-rich repeat-containing protein 2 n=1 Tax=Paramecium pentaurelia TaxID=43138 RepID=A0A8S1RYJ6_9CILI|nr:unnamed protein product [Paramecium pentaurelia]
MIHGPNSQFSGAFTIGKRYECAIYQTNPNPGPNHYSVNPIDKPTGYKFSKSSRKPLYQSTIAPDPGTYENKIQAILPHTSSVRFTKAKETSPKETEIGPGSYNLSDQKKAPAFTFQSRFDSIGSEIMKTPGPGNYELEHIHTQKPQNKGFSTSQRTNILLSNHPGPGSYEIEIPKFSTKIKFPKSQRSMDWSHVGPGPGAFDLNLPKQQGITFGSKRNQQIDRANVPGPGSYDPDVLDGKFKSIKGAKIGKSERSSQNFSKIGPSPLDYDVSNYKYPTRHASFNKAMRPSMISTERTPGPGSYIIDSKLKKNGAIIPKASKDQINLEHLPGPGRYNPNDSMTSNKGPSYHIAKKYDKPQESSLLGPGRYNIIRDVNDGPKYTFPTLEKSMEKKSIDLNQSHCYEIQQTIGYIPQYALHN